MKLRRFGPDGIAVSELCLSASNFARHANQAEAFAMLDAFRAAGGNAIQTSGICPGFSLGDSLLGLPEEFLGRWLADRRVPRAEMVIATRIAFSRPVIGGPAGYAELVESCARDSVRRMACGYLDLLFIEWTPAVLPLHDSVPAFDAVVRSGVTRSIGAAHFPVAAVRDGLNRTTQRSPGAFSGVQEDYSLVYRSGFEGGLARLCDDFGLGFLARSPLAGGRLVADPDRQLGSFEQRRGGEREIVAAARSVWPVVCAVARAHACAPSQVALAWVLARKEVASVLVSVRSVLQLRGLLDCTRLQLSPDELRRLDLRRPATAAAT